MKQLFQRVSDVLTPGGYFILEPQPWRSYKQTLHKQVGLSVAFVAGSI